MEKANVEAATDETLGQCLEIARRAVFDVMARVHGDANIDTMCNQILDILRKRPQLNPKFVENLLSQPESLDDILIHFQAMSKNP